MTVLETLALALATIAASALVSLLALRVLGRRLLDRPNLRSSHRQPVPRGGGVGFVPLAIIIIALVAIFADGAASWGVLAGAVMVAAVSLADDMGSIPASLRLAVQAGAVALALLSLPLDGPVIAAALPVWLDRLLLGLAWVWVINLFNFMDGIDGIAAGEAAVVGLGLVILGLTAPALGLATPEAAIVGAAAVGFLVVNWHPARLFMGDVGSVGLGFLVGWLMVDAASKGAGWAALILPLFFLADATTTLIARALRGRRLGEAHRDHAYQAAVDRGIPQPVVSGLVIALGLLLAALALVSRQAPALAVSGAVALVAGAILWLRWGRAGQLGKGGGSSER